MEILSSESQYNKPYENISTSLRVYGVNSAIFFYLIIFIDNLWAAAHCSQIIITI